MLIVTADDFGRSRGETDAALVCHAAGRITTVSAMVFMSDSERAAALAREQRVDAGLHLNLTQAFSADVADARLLESQRRLNRFLGASRYARLLYHPGLRGDFRYVVAAQFAEFGRLYGAPPSHVDGHRHQHLCTNLLVEPLIAPGTAVRRNFSFRPGEKGRWNRAYRRVVDRWLARRYRLTDYFFALAPALRRSGLAPIAELALRHNVELMAHPGMPAESDYLLSTECAHLFARLPMAAHVPP